MNNKWTVGELANGDFCKTYGQNIVGFITEPGEYGSKLKAVSYLDILARFPDDFVCNQEDSGYRDVPNTIKYELGQKIGFISLGEVEKVTGLLPDEKKIGILSDWFNRFSTWKVDDETRRFLGHPTILDNFIFWLIGYLALHDRIDGRISRISEEMINLARKIKNLGPVRRM